MKKIILSVCSVIAAITIMLSCDSNDNVASSSFEQNYTKVVEINRKTVYKFDVKDNSGRNHEILMCMTGSRRGGICMIELNMEKK